MLCLFSQIVHSKFQDLVPKAIDEEDPEISKPDEDEIEEVREDIFHLPVFSSVPLFSKWSMKNYQEITEILE